VLVAEVGARVLGVVVAEPRALLDLADGLADRFPHLLGHRLRVLPLVLAEDVRGVREQLLALAHRLFAPVLVGVFSALEGVLDVTRRVFRE